MIFLETYSFPQRVTVLVNVLKISELSYRKESGLQREFGLMGLHIYPSWDDFPNFLSEA